MTRFLVILAIVLGCSSPPKKHTHISGGSDAKEDVAADDMTQRARISTDFETLHDAYKYTLGVVKLEVDGGALKGQLEDSFVAYKADSEASSSLLSRAKRMCRFISIDKKDPIDREESGTFLSWRSYHPYEDVLALATAMVEEDISQMFCVLELTHNSEILSVVFDLLPTSRQSYLGTAKEDEAVEGKIMLINDSLSGNFRLQNSYKKASFSLDEDIELPYEVEAVNGTNTVAEATGNNPCYVIEGSSSQLANETQVIEIELDSRIEVSLVNLMDDLSASEKDDLCFTVGEQNRLEKLSATCQQLLNIGENDSCRMPIKVVNKNDPLNTMPYAKPEIAFQEIQIDNVRDSERILPEHPENPITLGDVMLNNFNDRQAHSMVRAFDLWLYVSPDSYEEFAKDHLKRINMVFDNPCGKNSGVVAFVQSFNTNWFNWCINGAMMERDVTEDNFPFTLLLKASVTLHETLHTLGRYHDATDPRGAVQAPCRGTSNAAVVSHDAYQCEKPACLPFKKTARNLYLMELDYDYGDKDPRRYQGQCAEWNKNMGLR